MDAGGEPDAGMLVDAGGDPDSGAPMDAGPTDAGPPPDAGPPVDAAGITDPCFGVYGDGPLTGVRELAAGANPLHNGSAAPSPGILRI